jgi:subtilisin family serine protease
MSENKFSGAEIILKAFVNEGVDIMNLSLGYSGVLDPTIEALLNKALERNIIVVCAAGNEGPYKNSLSKGESVFRCF